MSSGPGDLSFLSVFNTSESSSMEKQSGVASGGGCRAGESFSNCLSSGVTSEGPHWVSERYLAKASCCFDHGTGFPSILRRVLRSRKPVLRLRMVDQKCFADIFCDCVNCVRIHCRLSLRATFLSWRWCVKASWSWFWRSRLFLCNSSASCGVIHSAFGAYLRAWKVDCSACLIACTNLAL